MGHLLGSRRCLARCSFGQLLRCRVGGTNNIYKEGPNAFAPNRANEYRLRGKADIVKRGWSRLARSVLLPICRETLAREAAFSTYWPRPRDKIACGSHVCEVGHQVDPRGSTCG